MGRVRQADAWSGPALFSLIWDSRLKKYCPPNPILKVVTSTRLELFGVRDHVLPSIARVPSVQQGAFIMGPKPFVLKAREPMRARLTQTVPAGAGLGASVMEISWLNQA